jgi:hypothetical protein
MSLILGILDSGGAAAGAANSYESISTVTVGSGGSATVEFTSIPATYTHLQIRCLLKATNAGTDTTNLNITINSGTQNVRSHSIRGTGALVGAPINAGFYYTIIVPSTTGYANIFNSAIIDILDYANTNKNKTFRGIGGFDANGSGVISLASCLFNTTTAISSIKFETDGGAFTGWAEYSQFALYGIKGS